MYPGRKVNWAAGGEQYTSSPPQERERQNDNESRTDIKEQEIIYMYLSRQTDKETARRQQPASSVYKTTANAETTTSHNRIASSILPLPLTGCYP